MTAAQIVSAIRSVLQDKMNIAHMDAFCESARLNEDLYLDSVMILHLILHLELDMGLDIPDEALTREDFESVKSLADFLARLGSAASTPTHTGVPA